MSARKAARSGAKRPKPRLEGTELSVASDAYSRLCAGFWYQQHAKRIAASKKLLGLGFYRGDCHIHSHYSDGKLTVAQAKEAADVAGLDFIFVTDHATTDQKHDCRKFSRVWWGQEPGAGPHHLGIIGTQKTFEPSGDFLKDLYAARTTSQALTFVSHPTGGFHGKHYTPERIDVLYQLADPFHMEIVNGCNQFFDSWDITDAHNVQLWDRLLCKGKIVYAMGNSDAHMIHSVGSVWNGVFCEHCNKRSVMQALHQGRYFVSDAPLITISAGRAKMGQTIRPRKGSTLTFRIAAADSAGIYQLRLIKNGRVIKRLAGREQKRLSLTHRERFAGGRFYLRAEVSALDARRAFTNPIFVVG